MKVLSQTNIANTQASCVIFETPITIYKPDILETVYGEGFNELMNTFFAHEYGKVNKYFDKLDLNSLDTCKVFLSLCINIPQNDRKLDLSTIRRLISESLFIVSGNKSGQNYYYYPIFSFVEKYPIVRSTNELDSARMIFDVGDEEELLGSILDEIFFALTNINLDIPILYDKQKLFSYCLYYIVNAKTKEDNEWKLFQNV